MPLISGYGFAFATRVAGETIPFVISVNGDFAEGSYYDAPTFPASSGR